MAIPIEAYTAEGALAGVIDGAGRLRDVLETSESLHLAPIRGVALDGRTLESPGEDVPVDALLLVVPDDVDVPVHAAWHDIRLTIGPYRVDGELPTLPGFDPGRALARPTGTFVLLREVTVTVPDDGDRLVARHGRLLVNRYDVETVAASLVLGFFFPGAHQDVREPNEDVFLVPRAPTPATGDVATAGEASPVA